MLSLVNIYINQQLSLAKSPSLTYIHEKGDFAMFCCICQPESPADEQEMLFDHWLWLLDPGVPYGSLPFWQRFMESMDKTRKEKRARKKPC